MNRVKVGSLILLLSLTTLFLGAKSPLNNSVGLSIEGGWYASIPEPLHQEDLPIRTHYTVGATLTPASFRFGSRSEISLGISTYYTSRSLAYGFSIWRPFIAFGPTFDYSLYLTQRSSITVGFTPFFSLYLHILRPQPLYRYTVTYGYLLHSESLKNRFTLIVPLSLDVRDDYFALTLTVGLKWRYAYE